MNITARQQKIIDSMNGGKQLVVVSGKGFNRATCGGKQVSMATFSAMREKGLLYCDHSKGSYGRQVYLLREEA